MSGRQQRGRGGGGRDRGGPSRGSQSRGGSGDRSGGGGDRGRQGGGGPPGQGQSTQMAARPRQPAPQGGIYIGPAPTPDPTVTAAEDALVKETRGRKFDELFPGRRSYGTKGKNIVLRSNYFKINTPFDSNDPSITETVLYRYEVEVTPELTRPKQRRFITELLTDAKFNGLTWASDYGKIIVTRQELDFGEKEVWDGQVVLPPLDGNSQQQGPTPSFVQAGRDRNRVTFKVKRGASFSMRHIIDYLRSSSGGAMYQGRDDLIQVLNIIMCKQPQGHQFVANVGGNKFYPFGPHPGREYEELGGGLEALRGYYASVRPAVNRLLLNVNVTSGAFYKVVPVIDLINQSGLQSYEQQEAFLRMLKVTAHYKRDKDLEVHMTKTKSIVGFAKELPKPTFRVKRFGSANEVKFGYKDSNAPGAREQQISVADYFKHVRGITLRRPDLPVLNVATRADPQYIPQELCTVIAGQPYRRMLSGDQTSNMITFAAKPPNVNAMSIAGTQAAPGNGQRLFHLAIPAGGPDMQARSVKLFGMSVDTDMVNVHGRILPSPRLDYAANKNVNPYRGSWNLQNLKYAVPGGFRKWGVLVINRAGPRGNALMDQPRGDMFAPEALFNALEKALKSYGIRMGERAETQTIMLDSLIFPNRQSNDRKILGAFQEAKKQNVQMLLIVLPVADKWLYARIKYHGDVALGIHSINAIGTKLQKPGFGQPMFFGNLALKFNIKGGGVSHKISNVLTRPLDANTMLVGIDVTHPSPGSSEGAPSIACIVASVDDNLCQWPGSIRPQQGRVEMVANLDEMVLERLDLWHRKNKQLPGKIVIYRDGVSEGQYKDVHDYELKAFNSAFEKRYGEAKNWPKVAIIVVGKRHHCRFYATREEEADYDRNKGKGSWNTLPGTTVDRGVTQRNLGEFYLQAHQGLQGTARPAHYVIIKDDIGFEADEIQTFTHNLCYLFNRATKAVSICPPAYYADLLCERGCCYLFSALAENHASDSSVFSDAGAGWTRDAHENLKESTWYI